jgi:SH3 domain-containing protein
VCRTRNERAAGGVAQGEDGEKPFLNPCLEEAMPEIDRIRLSAATVALLAVVSLTGTSAVAEPLVYTPPPGAAPPWAGTSTPTTTTETKTDTSTAAIPALPTAQPAPVADAGTATPDQTTATPMQGTTTPTHAVFLHSAPIAGSPVIGTLRPGTVLRVLASANPGWIQVETPAGTGWAWGSYLAPASPAAPQ